MKKNATTLSLLIMLALFSLVSMAQNKQSGKTLIKQDTVFRLDMSSADLDYIYAVLDSNSRGILFGSNKMATIEDVRNTEYFRLQKLMQWFNQRVKIVAVEPKDIKK